ncbi:MAG: NUDIX domain-containing protein [Acidobacteria bacterium]|nr:NUDIX domain-containing protein [Acidobacteriota bacterium]
MSEEPVVEVTFGNVLAGIEYEPRPAAYAVIVDERGRVAAVRGVRGYFLPGGGSLPEETPADTIRREVLEELARAVRLRHKIGEAIQYFSAGAEHYRMHAVFYAADFTSEQRGEAEHELEWLDETELEGRFFHECHVWALRRLGGI